VLDHAVSVSAPAQDLLNGLLEPDPARRMGWLDMLRHPFLGEKVRFDSSSRHCFMQLSQCACQVTLGRLEKVLLDQRTQLSRARQLEAEVFLPVVALLELSTLCIHVAGDTTSEE
jgi:hypothetical protein